MEFIEKSNSVEIVFEDYDTQESKSVLLNALQIVRLLVILSQRTEGMVIPTGYAQERAKGNAK